MRWGAKAWFKVSRGSYVTRCRNCGAVKSVGKSLTGLSGSVRCSSCGSVIAWYANNKDEGEKMSGPSAVVVPNPFGRVPTGKELGQIAVKWSDEQYKAGTEEKSEVLLLLAMIEHQRRACDRASRTVTAVEKDQDSATQRILRRLL